MTTTNQNIEQLLSSCKLGDQRAQMEIYKRYYKAMYNTAFRIVKDSYKAEDIMQDSFLTAFTKLDTLKEISTFGSWLKRIVVNNSILDYNKKSYTVPIDDVLYKVEDEREENASDNKDFTSVKAKQILDSMNLLKDNYRIGLSLHLIEGYDYEEICEIMNISYANCRTMISRAKDRLRRKLEPTG
ncbi:sigma-70 family RNA polymerase sigma factor [Winogradskyella sp. 3972H.M.0a.05]|uniref:RNA polymerase sigma factor n=1 Tax=Winogradskyella sp. 3972H.M.0a.05 TaxID=2950277 RepID=UPI00339B66CC